MNTRCRTLARLKRDQSWFWTKNWQQGEKEVQRELDEKGPGKAYTAKELLPQGFRLRYDGRIVSERPTQAKQIVGSLSRYANPDKPVNAYDAKEKMEHDRAKELLAEITP